MQLSAARRPTPVRTRRQSGLSLVELMVGIAVGMFIVAAATLLVTTQLADNRRLLTETQIQQDLRAAADIVTRDLRRAGAVQLTDGHTALATATSPGARNVYAGALSTPAAGTVSQIVYRYSRTPPENGPFGFRLHDGAVQTAFGFAAAGGINWQDLTDRNTVQVTTFAIEQLVEPDVVLPCQRPCPGADPSACWPRMQVRRYRITITGQSVADPNVVRTLVTEVRPRTEDMFLPIDPTAAGPLSCP